MSRKGAILLALFCAAAGRRAGAVDVGPAKPVMMTIAPLSTLYEHRTMIDLRIIETTIRLDQAKRTRDNELNYLHKNRPSAAKPATLDEIVAKVRGMSDRDAAESYPLGWSIGWEQHSVRKVRELIGSIDADESALKQLQKLRDDLQKEIESSQRSRRDE